MKEEFYIRVPVWAAVPFLALAFIIIAAFARLYYAKNLEIESMNSSIAVLRAERTELEKYGNWTLDFFRIGVALNKMAGNKIPPETRRLLTERIWQISKTYDMDPLMILAIVSQESRGNMNARGRYKSGAESGAYGLMQLKFETAKTLARMFRMRLDSKDDLMLPEVNVVLGCAYLMRLIGRYGDVKSAVIAYNLGSGKVDRLLAAGQDLPTKYYEGVISKYWSMAADSIFVALLK